MADNDRGLKSKQREWNPRTLEHLVKRGIDPDKSLEFINVFYAESRDMAATLISVISDKGFSTRDPKKYTEDDSTTYWIIHASITLLPILELVNAMTDNCSDIAIECKVEYDGWYVQV